MTSRAVVLLSGGLDSATALAVARRDGHECFALSVDYGQRHSAELAAAAVVGRHLGVREHRTVHLDIGQFGGSALTDMRLDVPSQSSPGIPITYVPARNTVMLSLALGWAEVLEAGTIYIGVNAVDYSGYPDCRPAFIAAFQAMANLATRRAVEGSPILIETPLIDLGKDEIIGLGISLGVDYSLTVSCYRADSLGRACGSCDSCRFRRLGFEVAGIPDPTVYQH